MLTSSLRVAFIVALGIALATPMVAVLETGFGLADASSVYLVAVVVSAMVGGTLAAMATAVVSIVTYDLLFTEPFFTLMITDRSEWLSIVLFSFVGISVGQLVSLQRARTRDAHAREREAQDLYAVSRILATRTSTRTALADLATLLCAVSDLDRAWFSLGADDASERKVADSGGGPTRVGPYLLMQRHPEDSEVRWLQLHRTASGSTSDPGTIGLRAPIEWGGEQLGSFWAIGSRAALPPDATASRLLAGVVDQVGQVLRQDQLAEDAADLRIAQESSALKSALVESVSHDLRTPLVSIRAAAGTLKDPSVRLGVDEVASAATSIDRQAERLDRIVRDLLDLGRIQGGTLQTSHEAVELGEIVDRALSRLNDVDIASGEVRSVEVEVPDAWVDADPVLLEQAVLNVLENAFRHTPRDARIRVTCSQREEGSRVRLSVDDSGPGVPSTRRARLFERSPERGPSLSLERTSPGIGLTIVRGFVEAMGGRVSARRSELGGLGIDMDLPATRMPAEMLLPAR